MMATYPTLTTSYGSDPVPLKSIEIDRAEDGTARGRSFMATDKSRFTIKHPWLTAAEKSTLDAFYVANRLIQFDYTSPIDSIARVMLFAGPVQYRREYGERWAATVEMEEA